MSHKASKKHCTMVSNFPDQCVCIPTLHHCFQMLQTLKDPTIIGSYDTIAVYADNDAVDFFKRNGFTDDVVLCSRFR